MLAFIKVWIDGHSQWLDPQKMLPVSLLCWQLEYIHKKVYKNIQITGINWEIKLPSYLVKIQLNYQVQGIKKIPCVKLKWMEVQFDICIISHWSLVLERDDIFITAAAKWRHRQKPLWHPVLKWVGDKMRARCTNEVKIELDSLHNLSKHFRLLEIHTSTNDSLFLLIYFRPFS